MRLKPLARLCCLSGVLLAHSGSWAQLQGSLTLPAASKVGQRERTLLQVVPCETGCAGLVVRGLLSSSLHQGWGSLIVQSIDGLGRVLQESSTPPYQGTFQGAPIQLSLPVHPGARKVQLYAEILVRGSSAAGGLQWRDLLAKAGLHATAQAKGQSVGTAGQPLSWQLQLSQPAPGARCSFRVIDAQGKVVDEGQAVLGQGREPEFTSRALPSGYYRLEGELQAVAGSPTPISSAVIVQPQATTGENEARIGVDAVLSWYGGDDDQVQRSLRTLKALGVGALRDRLRWRDLQPSPARWRPQRELAVARLASKAGFQLLWTFHDAPDWTRSQLDGPEDMVPATDMAAVEQLGRRLGEMLGGLGQAVEFWNEPNSEFFQGDALLFANGYKAFSRGLAQARPDMLALYGAPVDPPGGPFFQLAARNNLGRWAPLANHHYYGAPEGLLAYRQGNGVEAPFLPVHTQARAWLTETGASVQRAEDGSLALSERQQADVLARMYAEGLQAGYERMYWLSWHELPEGNTSNWGLLRSDGSPRPAAATLGMVAQVLKGTQPAGVVRQGKATVHLFKAANGSYNAIAWGKLGDVPAAWLASASHTWDTLGHALGQVPASSSAPIFLQGLAKPPMPPTVTATLAASAPAAPKAEADSPRLLASVAQGGQPIAQTRSNAVTLPILAGQPFELRLQALGGGTPVCDGGDGLLPGAVQRTPDGVQCSYTLAPGAASSLSVSAHLQDAQGRVLDRAWIALGQSRDKSRKASQGPGTTIVPGVAFCKAWLKKSSGNLDVTIQGEGGLLSPCEGIDVISQTRSSADSWVFPALPTLLGLPEGARALRVRIAPLPGVPVPPKPMLLQLVNDKGTWLAPLGPLTAQATLDQEIDLALATPAPWRPGTPATFQASAIRSVMVGWGGQTTQPGQRYGFRILDIKAYP